MPRATLVTVIGALAAIAACGDDDDAPPVADAGVDAAAEIAAPAPPSFGTCAAGWRESTGEVVHCEPWPESGAADCGDGALHLPGTPGCAPLGEACPREGAWPAGLPTDVPVVFVRATAASGGDGSMSAPFDSIVTALGAAVAGSVVIVDGRFDATPVVMRSVELRGVCPARALIAPSVAGSSPTEAALTVRAAGVTVRGLSIGGARGGVRVESGGDAALHDVAIERATGIGLSIADGGTMRTDRVLVRAMRPNASGRYGVGALVEERGQLRLVRAAFESNVSAGVLTLGGALSLSEVVIRDTLFEPTRRDVGNGLAVLGGVAVDAEYVVLERNCDASVMVVEASSLVLRDSVIRDTRPRGVDDSAGRGLFVIEGSSAVLERVFMSGHRETGVLASGSGSRVTLRDVVITDTEGRVSDGGGGSGIALQMNAEATLERVLLRRNRGTGLIVGSASTMTLSDLVVRETRGFAHDGLKGTGLHVQLGGLITGARVAVLANREVGILAIERDSRVMLSDVRVEGTLERECVTTTCPDVAFGDGLVAAIDAQITLERFVIADCARGGVVVGGASVDLHGGRGSGNPIGANVQTPEFDFMRLADGVVFSDNGRNLDTMSLPVPSSRF